MLFKHVKTAIGDRWFQIFLLLLSMIVGAILRLTNLTEKTIWSDEFSTIVFSLGNSFKTVPLNEVISLDTLLQPIVPNPNFTVVNTIHNLFTESTHPPLYFMLNHWWFRLFYPESGLVSLWGARSLSVVFGILSIPATFGLGWLTFRSLMPAQISAALMAVSPFSVSLAQDARHYTLAILWLIASISCFIVAIRYLVSDRQLPVSLLIYWTLANCLGVATHYFVIITLAAEAVVLIWLKLKSPRQNQQQNWWKIYAVAFITLSSCSIWLLVWQNLHDKNLINWIYGANDPLTNLIAPIAQLPLAWATMLFLLPVERQPIIAIAISALLMVGLLILTIYGVLKAWKIAKKQRDPVPEFGWLGGLIGSVIGIFLILAYVKFSDIMSAVRYNFTYFPALIVLVAGSLSMYLQFPGIYDFKIFKRRISGKSLVLWLWVVGLVGSLVVVSGLGFQKPYRADLLTKNIIETSSEKTLITIFHHSHIQTSKMMGIAWEMKTKNLGKLDNYQFLLNNPQCKSESPCVPIEKLLYDTVAKMPKPLDVWVVDYPSLDFNVGDRCALDPQTTFKFPGFRAKRYRCPNSE